MFILKTLHSYSSQEILHGAAATAATAVETTTFTAGINEIPTPTITAPASSLQSKQYTGTIEQEVVGEAVLEQGCSENESGRERKNESVNERVKKLLLSLENRSEKVEKEAYKG